MASRDNTEDLIVAGDGVSPTMSLTGRKGRQSRYLSATEAAPRISLGVLSISFRRFHLWQEALLLEIDVYGEASIDGFVK